MQCHSSSVTIVRCCLRDIRAYWIGNWKFRKRVSRQIYGGIFAVNLELTGDNEPLLEENDRQRCQLVANQLPTVFRASFRSTKRPATTATNSQLSILRVCPNSVPTFFSTVTSKQVSLPLWTRMHLLYHFLYSSCPTNYQSTRLSTVL